MSKENLEKFCLLVLRDLELQKQLKDLTSREDFVAKVVELGSLAGFEISREDVENEMRENRKLWIERWI